MRKRSPANSAASSPPVPARTSGMAEAFSSLSLGARSSATSRSRPGSRSFSAASSSRALQRLPGVHHRLQLGVLLRQLDDLGAVGGRAHPRLHLAEAVENLFEAG